MASSAHRDPFTDGVTKRMRLLPQEDWGKGIGAVVRETVLLARPTAVLIEISGKKLAYLIARLVAGGRTPNSRVKFGSRLTALVQHLCAP